MAKRSNDLSSGTDKAKVRLLFAQVEGSNESIQEAFRTMVSAMGSPVRIITEQTANITPPAMLEQPAIESLKDNDSPTSGSSEGAEEVPASSDRKPRGAGKRTDRNSSLDQIPDLDFRPSGHLNLKEFWDSKHPENNLEEVLVATYFMQHMMKISAISASHVYSAFKTAGKRIPADLSQTIRNAKSSKMWINFSGLDNIRTTTQGDNHVEHELGKGG